MEVKDSHQRNCTDSTVLPPTVRDRGRPLSACPGEQVGGPDFRSEPCQISDLNTGL